MGQLIDQNSAKRRKTMIQSESRIVLFEYPQEEEDTKKTRPENIVFTRDEEKRLNERQFLNDTIITFFMQQHLDEETIPRIRKRVHLFNNFFYSKIDYITKSINETRELSITYDCASRWLRGTKLFDRDFVFMPICSKEHWVLVVLCYPANNVNLQRGSNQTNDDTYEPAIFVLNSSCEHPRIPKLETTLGKFLRFQWHKENQELRDFTICDSKLRGIRLLYPKVPQQRNKYDCGVYILNYFYCFIKDPRRNYLDMMQEKSFKDWFTENNIDIKLERARMCSIVKEYQTSYDKLTRVNGRTRASHQAAHDTTSDEGATSIDDDTDILDEHITIYKPRPRHR